MNISRLVLRSTIVATIAAAIASCGAPRSEGSGQASQREGGGSAPDGKTNSATEPETIAAPEDGSACLADCNPPKEVVVSFANAVSLAPQGCTASNVLAFDGGDGFVAFVQANCSGFDSLYARQISYGGDLNPTQVSLDTICPSGRGGVTSFTADRGASGYLLAVSCRATQTSFSTYAVSTDAAGHVGSSRLLATTSNVAESAAVAWNEDAGIFGVARSGTFQRFAEDGQLVGGSVAVPASGTLIGLSSQHGSWNVLQGASTMNTYQGTYCSKISEVGTLHCDREPLNDVSYSNTIQGVAGGWVFSASASGELWTGSFDSLTCSRGDLYSFGKVVDQKIGQYFDGAVLGQTYLAVLYASGGPALNVAFLDVQGRKIVSTSAVFDGLPLRSAHLLVTQKRLFVIAASGNDAVITWTEQTIDP